MKVGDAYKLFSKKTEMVDPDTSIDKVVSIFMKEKKIRNIYVVDGETKLVGMITVNEIFTSVKPDITPNKIAFLLKKKTIKTAKDIMIEPVTVTPEDDLEDALRTAEVFRIHDIPVCENGRLIGELDPFELIYGLLKSKKQVIKR